MSLIRKNALAFAIFVLTAIFVLLGVAFGGKLRVAFMTSGDIPGSTAPADTPTAAVQRLFENVQRRNLDSAYKYVANQQDESADAFARDIGGSDGNLKSLAALSDFQVRSLSKSGNEARVRADLQWSTPVGGFFENREFNVAQDKSGWKVIWPVDHQPKMAPQVVPVTYERWDITRETQPAADSSSVKPKVRIISQTAAQDADTFVIVGELVNEDTVPAMVSVNATLVGANGEKLAQESSFDSIVHDLLPGERTPFRIDFPGTERSRVKNIQLTVGSHLVAASGAPVIQVADARIEPISDGRKQLRGQLVNQTGDTVNIPQVLASYYDSAGKVIWVSTTYLDHALLPQIPLAFSMQVPADVARNVQSYKVTVNSYSIDQT